MEVNMKVLLYTTIFTLLVLSTLSYSQDWQQTASTPEGAGVTDMVVRESNQHLFVTTGSFNWPNGDDGGIRRSTDEGASWENLNDVYVARTIIDGGDGNLYASIWPYPSDEGLYRSTDDGDTWGSPLVTVPSGNNIFSIALNPTTPTQTIFAGTRNGPLRSTDNGVTWSPAINGIPPNSWVRDIEVDSGGIVVAATTNGIFSSTNNGDLWEQATGVTDTIVKIIFDYPLVTENLGPKTRVLAGSDNGTLVEAFENSKYLSYTLLAILTPNEEWAAFWQLNLANLNQKLLGAATFPRNNQGGGYYKSTDNGQTWNQENTGLPSNPKTSALSGAVVETRKATEIKEYLGFFENTNGGARIFKRETVVSVEKVNDLTPLDYILSQNYPNPFNPTTNIEYSIPQEFFVELKVYDILGNKVAELVNEVQSAGTYRADFSGENLASGLYIARIKAGNFTQSIKMSLMK
jgi:photosystem II stability/assembly factor-like uncharacterized protein